MVVHDDDTSPPEHITISVWDKPFKRVDVSPEKRRLIIALYRTCSWAGPATIQDDAQRHYNVTLTDDEILTTIKG